MTAAALLLVVLAALCHASWNFLTKRSTSRLDFLWWTGLVGSLLFLPPVLWLTPDWVWPPSVWGRIGLAAALRAGYFLALRAAYGHGDLSLVYPLARGTAVVLVLPLAMLFLGETPVLVGVLGVIFVGVGAYVLHLPGLSRAALQAPLRALRRPHAGYALLTGLLIATYSLVDKWNMGHGIHPLVYAYLTIPIAALLLTPLVLRDREALWAEWRANRRAIPAVACLMPGGYLFVLFALQLSPVSYVAAARELAVVFGTLLGILALRERYFLPRLLGASLIVAGVILLGAAPASGPR